MITITPSTSPWAFDIDLSRSTGPATFEVDGALGAGEEFGFNTINSDNTALQIVENSEAKKLTMANTVAVIYGSIRLRITKTETVLPVGIRVSRIGL